MADRMEGMTRRRRGALVALIAVLVVVVAGVGLIVSLSAEDEPVVAETTTTTARPMRAASTSSPEAPTEVPRSTPLATPKGQIATFDGPGGAEIGTVGLWYGYQMTMPIVEEKGDWLRIMLPERPNMSTAWVRADSVTRSTSPWRMVLRLGETRVHVYNAGVEVWNAPVGIGRDNTRTPTGSFFVAVIEKPGPSGYGPVVLNLNAHSEDIASWEGSGDAISAFHGPIGADALLRSGGGKVSNGCIRMLPEDQLKMDPITLGTPVDIVA